MKKKRKKSVASTPRPAHGAAQKWMSGWGCSFPPYWGAGRQIGGPALEHLTIGLLKPTLYIQVDNLVNDRSQKRDPVGCLKPTIYVRVNR